MCPIPQFHHTQKIIIYFIILNYQFAFKLKINTCSDNAT